ncbi:hypothetical protein ACS0TY_023459 [Phlomoides rotata]
MESGSCGSTGKVIREDEIDGNKSLHNISMQTGEEFSPTFLRDRVTSRRTPAKNDTVQTPMSKPGFDVIQNHQLTALRNIRRRDSESCIEYSDFSPGIGYGFDIYSFGSPNSYQPSGKGSGVIGGTFSGKIKFLCSFGGRILPRPNDGKLRYVGGDTRIMSIRNNITHQELMKNTLAICNYHHTIKYQLPGEDLDALISVSSDEDLHHMIEEYYDLEKTSQRLRIFLVSSVDLEGPSSSEYIVAVNGMLEPSNQRSFSRESLESQRESPTPVRDLENQNAQVINAPQVPSKSCMPSPPLSHIQFADPKTSYVKGYEDAKSPFGFPNNCPVNDNPCGFDASGYYQNNPVDTLPMIGSPNQNSHMVKPHATPQVGSHFCKPSKEFQPPPYAPNYSDGRRGFPNAVSLHPEELVPGFHAIPYRRETNLLPDSQQTDEEGPNASVEDGREKSCRAFAEGKSQSLGMSSSSQEEAVEEQIAHDQKYKISRNQDQLYQKRTNLDKEYSKCGRDSTELMKNNETCSDKDKKNYATDMEYNSNTNFLEHKSNLPQIICRRDSQFSLHVPESESQVNAGKDCSSSCAEKGTGLVKEMPGNYEISLNEHEFHIKSQKGNSDLKQFFDSDVLHSVSAKRNNPSQFVSPALLPDKSNSGLCLSDNDALGGKKKPDRNSGQESSSKNGCFINTSDNCHETSILEKPVAVELNDETESPGGKPGAESHLYESGDDDDDDDVEVDEESKGESLSDAAIIEMEASIYGLQIIKNADLEDQQELGSGTFGTVYHGKWRGTDVAIKRIKKSCFSGRSSEQEKLTKDFWREAKILSRLHHPNIVAFYGVVPDGPGGTLATVAEYLVNGSLRRVLLRKDRALDRRKKVVIALDAAFGMEYLHLKNIVHFDLKCDNLLVNLGDPQRPVCKVGDFGLSRIKQNTLVSGGVRGTLPWMAPELLNGNSSRVSEKVDVFSFGIAMWEILTGDEPYINMHCGAIIGGIVTNTLRPPIPERCDPEWRKLMEDCWSHEPEARPSFTEITNRLRVMSKAIQPKRPAGVRR